MTRRIPRLLLLPCALLAAGCEALTGNRDAWQQPEAVIRHLDIGPGDRLADLGAGEGYFTLRLAEATGPTGRVHAVDVDGPALHELAARAEAAGLGHVETRLASATDAGLPPGSVDLVFACNVYHHLPDRVAYFAQLRGALRPGGRVAVVELDDLPWFMAPLLAAHRTPPETIRRDLEAAGYRLVERFDFLAHQSFQVFAPAP